MHTSAVKFKIIIKLYPKQCYEINMLKFNAHFNFTVFFFLLKNIYDKLWCMYDLRYDLIRQKDELMRVFCKKNEYLLRYHFDKKKNSRMSTGP